MESIIKCVGEGCQGLVNQSGNSNTGAFQIVSSILDSEPSYVSIMPSWAWLGIGIVSLIILLIILWSLIGYPMWNVWASQKAGEADLRQARNEQQIQIAQAQSRLDAAELNKKSAIVEAQAVSAQIKEIGVQLLAHDLYLKWQWIKMMEDRQGETIYVPTEANLPILEATRR